MAYQSHPQRFSVVRPIGGDLIVVDRDAGIAKIVVDSGERDLWLRGLLVCFLRKFGSIQISVLQMPILLPLQCTKT